MQKNKVVSGYWFCKNCQNLIPLASQNENEVVRDEDAVFCCDVSDNENGSVVLQEVFLHNNSSLPTN